MMLGLRIYRTMSVCVCLCDRWGEMCMVQHYHSHYTYLAGVAEKQKRETLHFTLSLAFLSLTRLLGGF